MSEEKKTSGGKETHRLPKEQWGRQSYPIKSEIKGGRVYMSEPIDETCWAYMKLLREQSSSKKIYPVDPYAEVYTFRDNIYGILTESLDGMGDSWMYLVVGEEKALLVDTSFGLGNLKGLCDELTGGKELIVVNTHCHFDHAYGNAQFDRVYCHEYEYPSIANQTEHIYDYLFDEDTGEGIWYDFERSELIEFKPYEVIGVPDGYTWDLGGGHEIELVFLGGHSAGHAGFLDKKDKVFFAGDDIISMRVSVGGPRPGVKFGEYATISTMCANLKKLWERRDEYDHVFTGHFVTDLEYTVIGNMVETCEKVIEDPVGAAIYSKESKRGVQYFAHVEGLGTLAYSLAAVGK